MIGSNKEEMIRILEFFSENDIKVHVARTDDIFNNGIIIRIDDEKEMLVLNDIKSGTTPIPFSIIKRVEEFREMRE